MIWPKPYGPARFQTQSFRFEQNEDECVIWFSRADILLRELLLKRHMLPKDPWQGAQGAYICIWLLPKRSPSHLRLTYIKGNCTPTNHVFSFIFVTIIVRRVGRSSSMKIERCHIVAVYSGTNRQVGDTWHKLAHLTIEEVHLVQLRCNPSVNPAGRSVALHRDLTHTEGAAWRNLGPLRASLFVVYVSPCFASIRWGPRTETRISPKWRFKGKRDF